MVSDVKELAGRLIDFTLSNAMVSAHGHPHEPDAKLLLQEPARSVGPGRSWTTPVPESGRCHLLAVVIAWPTGGSARSGDDFQILFQRTDCQDSRHERDRTCP